MGKIEVLNLVLTKLDIELGLAQPQLVIKFFTFNVYLPHTKDKSPDSIRSITDP